MTNDKPSLSAKQVARHLDRRQTRRKLLLWTALVAAIALAITYLTCGKGWGIGGTGKGDGEGSAKGLVTAGDAGPRQCVIFIASEGITVDGVKMSRDQAVAACKPADEVKVIIAGDTRRGDWDELEAALVAANIKFSKQEPRGSPADAGAGP